MSRDRKIVIALLVFIFILISTILLFWFSHMEKDNIPNNTSDPTLTDAVRFKTEYEALNESVNGSKVIKLEISEENPIQYISNENLIDTLNTNTGVFYFGFPSCPWCRNMLPVLLEVAKENHIDTIYYFDVQKIRQADNTLYQNLLRILDRYLEEDENGNKVLYVPDVYVVRDGTIVDHHLSTVESQTDPYVHLTEKQRKELKEIYQKMVDKIR